MEAVRQKKPRPKQKESTPVREAPAIPARPPVVVQGMVLPEVPQRPPRSIERSASPEPEDVILSEESFSSLPTPNETEEERPRSPVPNLIFPRTEEAAVSSEPVVATMSAKEREALVSARLAPALPAYPTVPELSASASTLAYPSTASRLPMYSEIEKSREYEKTAPPVEDAPPMYPSLSHMIFGKTEEGLLTEQQLLTFYHNPLYEKTEEFVDKFVESEEVPDGPLVSMLRRLRQISIEMTVADVAEKENAEQLTRSFRECWTRVQKSQDFKGRCGENKEGMGTVVFQSAMYSAAKRADVKSLLSGNRVLMLEQRLCNESKFRSLGLQIQWQVIAINNQFMGENNLSVQSSPCLLESAIKTTGRHLVLKSLSDLFYHLRSPQIAKRFSDAVVGWITELVSVLHMSCRAEDAQFVLNHLLRLPSPISEWAAPLVQTFIQAPSSAKLKVDYCVTMLSHLMNPIKSRESFLRLLGQSEKEDAAWTILGDDDEQSEFSFVTVNEADLTSLLDQMPISELYSVAYLHFSTASAEKSAQFLSTLAFQLLLMKVLDDGLSTYAKPGYKQFCKQIGNCIRESVRELCSHWRVTKNVVSGEEENQLQREVDRVLLLALQYLINRDSAGLWQFLVDLPYDCVSEECRNRCEFMLRSVNKVELKELYSFPVTEINAKLKSVGLRERTDNLGPLDAVFLVNALSTISSHSLKEPAQFMSEIIEVCFCDSSSRDSLYKVGGEGVATLLARRPAALDPLLRILDRNIDHMDNYAVDVLASSSLTSCRVSQGVLEVLGKWLINKAPNEPANRLARRVLSGLFWGRSDTGDRMWIDESIHEICADIVIKAHSVHCSQSNGMIAKSISKITKMASKVADHEQLFTQFCWDILIKLKLIEKEITSKPQNDLAAFFIHLTQSYINSIPVFLDRGVPLLSDLVSSGSATACVVLLARLMQKHHREEALLGANKPFMEVLERLLHVDQYSYAVQWLSGPSSTPTPIVRLICSSISYHARTVPDVGVYLRSWVDLLCVKRITVWNTDQVTLQVLGTIVRIALLKDPKGLLGLPEMIHNLYMQMLAAAREAGKGFLSFLQSEQAPPPLAVPSHYAVSPFATYLLLLVEAKAFPQFMQHVYESLAKKDKNNLEYAVKKATSKTSLALPVTSLSVFRWAAFVPICRQSAVFPLVLQRLASDTYRLRTINGAKHQFARRLIDCVSCETIMNECRTAMSEVADDRGFVRAISGWLFTKLEVTRNHFDFSQFDLDYLLQLVLAGDRNIWLDYVDMVGMQKEEDADEKLYSATCHLGLKERTAQISLNPIIPNRTGRSRAQPFPCLPAHPGLPPAPVVDSAMLFQQHNLLAIAAPVIKNINQMADHFVLGGDNMTREDDLYCELVDKLYTSTSRSLSITIKCGLRCAVPTNTQVTVTTMEFSAAVDAQMTQNREKRTTVWSELFGNIMDRTALHTAGLEHMARQVAHMTASCPPTHRAGAQLTGRALFYLVTSSLSDTDVLYPAATAAYEHTLRVLGEEFVRNRPEEQIQVMRLVLDGFVLSNPLVEVFTPECLSSTELCDAYGRLSESVRDAERSPRALKLLGRLGIDRAAASLPPHQFAPLLPLAFRNLASQPDRAAPLHQLCMQHVLSFVFHAFPVNFTAGLDLALDGCNTGVTPTELLQSFVDRLGAEDFQNPKTEFVLPHANCNECVSVLSRRLADARSRLPIMYSVWGRYLGSVTRLAQLFIFRPVIDTYDAESPLTVKQRDLQDVFARVCAVWNPLIVPPSPSLAPFSPSNDSEAKLVMDRYVQLLSALPHSTAIPPGFQTLLSLVWQYYFEKLSHLTHGTTHYYGIIESYLVRLHWPSLWPSLRGLSAMDDTLSSRSQDCAPFVAQLVVRIHWKTVLQNHVPADMLPNYLSTLCSVLARIISKKEYYAKVAASLSDVLKPLSLRSDWQLVSTEACDKLASTVATVLPQDSLSSSSEHVAIFLIIWRKVCCFSPRDASTSTIEKQTFWLRSACSLLVRGGATGALPPYNSLISDVHTIALQHDNLRGFCAVARELTAVWAVISDGKFGEALVSGWSAYLAASPQSPLVVCCLHSVVGSLNADQVTTALKVLEKTIQTYFMRQSCKWSEVMEWIQFPAETHAGVEQYLLTPPSSDDKSIQPQLLTLKVFLDCARRPDRSFLSLHSYVCNIKPKHVGCEASFLMLLHRLLVWLAASSSRLPASFSLSDDLLHPLIRWLTKAARDDSSFLKNLVSSTKTTHSSKMRCVLTILELYLTQQSMGEGKRPRCVEGAAVMNSRIQALKEAAGNRAFQQYSSTFNLATGYFSQVELHHLGSAPSLLLKLSQSLYKERFLTDR